MNVVDLIDKDQPVEQYRAYIFKTCYKKTLTYVHASCEVKSRDQIMLLPSTILKCCGVRSMHLLYSEEILNIFLVVKK
jgi:hypothetical protein